jgi:hypothetical protein
MSPMSKGRPLLGKEKRQRYQIMLEPSVADQLRSLGRGSLTAGINVLFNFGVAACALAEKKPKSRSRTKHKQVKT